MPAHPCSCPDPWLPAKRAPSRQRQAVSMLRNAARQSCHWRGARCWPSFYIEKKQTRKRPAAQENGRPLAFKEWCRPYFFAAAYSAAALSQSTTFHHALM